MSRLAFLFPGQGSQYPGMGRALDEAFPASHAVFDEVDRALGFPLSRLCFEGPASELALTENTQPAILAASLAALRALESRGLRPAGTAGHSLGEWTAHVVAGTLGLTDAARLVRRRGRFMQEAVPVGQGAMAAVLGLDTAGVEQACREAAGARVVQPANLNAPEQVVIAGHADAVERACEGARRRGARRVVPLEVSAPFHCALMEPAARRLEGALDEVALADPRLPVFANVDGRPVEDAGAARRALVRQVASPVRWCDVVQAMVAAGYDTFVEVGPGKVLSGLVRRIHRPARVLSVEDPAGVERAVEELGVLAAQAGDDRGDATRGADGGEG